MRLHVNHVFCTSPCWGEGTYWCRYLVSIDRIPEGKDYHDEPEKDWINLTEEFDYFDEERYKGNLGFVSLQGITDEVLRKMAMKKARQLKPEVLEWLNTIKERKDEDYTQGWCCGNEDYLAFSSMSISIFFHRKVDAISFIRRWSVHKKPTSFFDYFKQ